MWGLRARRVQLPAGEARFVRLRARTRQSGGDHPSTRAQCEMGGDMATWQYHVFTFVAPETIPEEWLSQRLNELGARGWELVSTLGTASSSGRTWSFAAVLKRPAA
jgi:hypothetical protein